MVKNKMNDKVKMNHKTKKSLPLLLGTAICCFVYLTVTPFCVLAEEGEPVQQTEPMQQTEPVQPTEPMQQGIHWQQADGIWYLVGEDGMLRTGWQQNDGHWYYLNEAGAMATGWNEIDGKYYFFQESGAMVDGSMKVGETLYTFAPEGHLAYAKRAKNSGGGAFELGFYSQECRELADNLNELKEDAFDGDEDEDYYEDDKVDYDKDASFVISGRLTEIAKHRLEAARTRGYGNGRIPEEGELKDYLKAISYNQGRRSMEVYLRNCDGADEAEAKLLREHGSEEKKRSDRAVYYKEMGIAHENVNGKDYYMVIFMK